MIGPMTSLFDFGASANPGTLMLLGKATFLLAAALGVTAAMRRASAGSRHLVLVATFVSLLVLPLVAARLPLQLRVLPQSLQPAELETRLRPQSRAPVAEQSAILRAPDAPAAGNETQGRGPSAETSGAGSVRQANPTDTPAPAPSRWSLGIVLVSVWAGGVVVFLGWLAHGQWMVRRIVNQAPPMNSDEWQRALWEVADRLDLEQVPLLLQSERTHMPFASGFLRPVIVLPTDAESWSADRRAAVLLHELAHVRRKDLVGHTLGRIACALYWFHPLVWAAAKRLRVESERACDDFAITCGARASDYAEHLLDIVTAVRKQITPAVAMAMAHRKEFEGRMLAILDPEVPRARPSRKQAVVSVAGLAALSLVVAAAAPAAPRNLTPSLGSVDSSAATAAQLAEPSQAPRADTPTSTSATATVTNDRTSSRVVAVDRSSTTVEETESPTPAAQPRPQVAPQVQVQLDEQTRTALAHIGTDFAEKLLSSFKSTPPQGKGDDRAGLLIKVLRSDTSASLRRIAAWGLGNLDHDRAVTDALAEALRRDRDADVREMAAWALGEGSDGSAGVDALAAALRGDADVDVKRTAAWAIGEIGGSSSLDALAEAARGSDAELRMTAIWAIGQIEPKSAPREVVSALNDSSKRVRLLAAWALFQIGDPDAAPALETALARDPDKDLQRAYVRALASTGERSADALSRLLGSNDPEIRAIAVRALAGSNGTGPWPWPWPKPRPNP